MDCVVWNVKGFTDPTRQREVVSKLVNLKVNIVGILETELSRLIVTKLIIGIFRLKFC